MLSKVASWVYCLLSVIAFNLMLIGIDHEVWKTNIWFPFAPDYNLIKLNATGAIGFLITILIIKRKSKAY